ncbi:MAG TPA: hypothetical protein VFV99_15710 [Kofleriaceae bacterium]|nr:hypothetical protein [Kofleriaceae bacterium]
MKGCALLALLVACGPGTRGGDGLGDDDQSMTDGSMNANECPMGAELVYVIDQFNYRISTFNPATKTFTDLGSLSCPAMGGAGPFSMSVDRQAIAWVLYDSGELFRVVLPSLACTKTTWNSGGELKVFGMGFSTDEPMGDKETLYVGGGANQMQTSYKLAKFDTSSLTAQVIGTQTQLPEMTGNAKAELWGFMPDATNARVVQFDKTNGSALKTYMLPTLAGTMTGYAFAHWGGDYWVFLIKNAEPSTTVYQVDGATGTIKSTTPTTGRTIVGAGVSTCAPTVIL